MKVIYIQCPKCKKGWFGERIDDFTLRTSDGSIVDIQKECHCFECGTDYTPVSEEVVGDEDKVANRYLIGIPFDDNGEEKIVYLSLKASTHVAVMEDFVANMVTTCRGH